ncbi:exodeoxyribonuclease I [Candidatus Saccharibacteria bacterium]|nr:exodeoxyribonuclease I [Candidatus Saccharibacteria bacterium]
MDKTFFFYDLETSGLNQRYDRIMQFAGQRTDMELNPIGEPVNVLVKMTDDALPSPSAIMVTKITPQQTLADGVSEAEFCRFVTEEVFVPNTIAVGYNTVRFDDEFMRATMWRNFYDPYEWEWKDGRSRWDMLDVVRLTRALRPEGINWPFTDEGKPTNRLELITKLNGLKHEHAHDALSDVYATIAVAKIIRDKQPELFNYLLKMRDKREVKKLVNLDNKKPFVYASGRYANEYNKTTVVVPLTVGRNGNVLVYDLRYNLEKILPVDGSCQALSPPISQAQWGSPSAPVTRLAGDLRKSPVKNTNSSLFPTVKELCYNKCPAVAPLGVLESANGWEKIGLTLEQVQKNLNTLMAHPEFAEQMRTKWENQPEFPPAEEPELALYDGFLNDRDRIKVAAVRNADANRLADFHPDFDDARLPELLLHYKGRNFPESLSESENEKWQAYRRARLQKQAEKFLKELEACQVRDEFIAEELRLYFESLANYD